MNREKKIEYLKDEINTIRVIKRQLFHDEIEETNVDIDKLDFMHCLFEIALDFIQLPKRTLETLEVGDYVEITFIEDEHIGNHVTVLGTVREVIHLQSGYKWFWVNEYEIGFDEVINIEIIPHEAFELLKEVVEYEENDYLEEYFLNAFKMLVDKIF